MKHCWGTGYLHDLKVNLTYHLYTYTNMEDTFLVKWSHLTSPIMGQSDIHVPHDVMRWGQNHLHGLLDESVYPESNYGETIRQMQIEEHSVKQLVWSRQNGNEIKSFLKSRVCSRLKMTRKMWWINVTQSLLGPWRKEVMKDIIGIVGKF